MDKWKKVKDLYHKTRNRRRSTSPSADKLWSAWRGRTDYLYVFGGNDLKSGRYTVERYDINAKTWEPIGKGMPTQAESYAVAIYEDLIWVIGGEVGEDREKTAIPDVYSTDDTIEQWTAKRRLSRGRASLGVVVFNDSLYAVGGRGEDEIFDTTEVYDSEANKWIPGASLNQRRYGFGITTYKGQIFVAGGSDSGARPLRSVEVFSSESLQWTTQEHGLTVARASLRLANLTRHMYAVDGGCYTPNTEFFDELTNTWRRISYTRPSDRLHYDKKTAAIAWDNKVLYCIGGIDQDQSRPWFSERCRFVYIFDTFKDVWFRIQDMLEGRSGAQALVMYDRQVSSKSTKQRKVRCDLNTPPKISQPFVTTPSRREKHIENTPPRSLQYKTTAESGACGGSGAGGVTQPHLANQSATKSKIPTSPATQTIPAKQTVIPSIPPLDRATREVLAKLTEGLTPDRSAGAGIVSLSNFEEMCGERHRARTGAYNPGAWGWSWNIFERGECMYVFGGTGAKLGTMERYDFRDNNWYMIDAVMPHSGVGCAAALFNNEAWIMGGSYDDNSVHTEVHSFGGEMWIPEMPMHRERAALGAAVLDGELFAVGGKFDKKAMDVVEIYTNGRGWRDGANLNFARFDFGITEHEGEIYVAGGADEDGHTMESVEVYSSGTWTVAYGSLITSQNSFALITAGDMYYGRPLSNTVYAFGGSFPEYLGGRVWHKLCKLDIERDRPGLAVATHGKYIYLIGGDEPQFHYTMSRVLLGDSIEKSRFVNVYHTKSKLWGEISMMNEARSGCHAVVFCDCRSDF